ncbi:FAD-dependent oxidoreductase [Mastigocoleus sp. MO_188.B34]|uniref:FAD-dependent oxidoreductase n=1 Tax=Mastigocoleus sp. MO_188.B34 TaxID=3036635 RepID=UPI00260DCA3B|nr:FAD-dependent oxidoreductase [Mastigocoleus sp. MO_188.B34]MDJ0695931.1 FAD-dependent oxidoreductase [Mastigocoleus sp. MO_188.B34]
MTLTEEVLKTLPGDILGKLRQGDRILKSIREGSAPVPMVVKENPHPLEQVNWDVVISGGTLGILIGSALVMQGWRVAIIERGILQGREQEWNISRQELEVFLQLNLLSKEELETAIVTEYNPARVGFQGSPDIWVEGVLNIGVYPVYLLETLKQKFLKAGGKLFENTSFVDAVVHPNGVNVNNQFTTRLLIDAMGHFSPIAQQARKGKKADAMCLVVGSCAEGFPENKTGDLFVSFTPVQKQCQYFWEAFPAKDGRTTYMFTYMDTNPQRQSLETLYEDYLRLMPEYQSVELSQLKFKRVLFGFFPSYRQSPLRTPWDRILPIGDSSGSQSPLSFGGFGAMVRHLPRLASGIEEALQTEQLSAEGLNLLQPYQPSLTVTWLFQKAMSVGINQKINPEQINQLLSVVFQRMEELGESVLKPFLQDIVQFSALTKSLLTIGIFHPKLVLQIFPQVGLGALLHWIIHYINLGIYSVLFKLSLMLKPLLNGLPEVPKYYLNRWFDAWKYGSGSDYHLENK